jgi:hypothetical protein
MTTWVVVSVIVLGATTLLARFWKWATGPSPISLYSPAAVRGALEILLTNGARGARLRFQVANNSGVRLDVVKHIKAHGDVRLRVVVEKTPKMNSEYDRLAQAIRESVPSAESKVLPNGRERFEIEMGMDVLSTERLVRTAFEKGLGHSLARDVVGYYDLVLVKNVPRLTGIDPL